MILTNTEVVLLRPGLVEIRDAPMPVPKENEALIKVEYVGICGSDIHTFEKGPFIPPRDPRQNICLGHECAGEVVETGAGVTSLRAGDKVCIEPGIPCGVCRYCREGRYNLCPDMDFLATQPHYRGALTNYIAYPANFTFKLPAGISTLEGALAEPAAVGMHAAMHGGAGPGSKVFILGAGCIGLMTLQACHALGASEIIIADMLDKRLEMARKLGAMAGVNGNTEDLAARCREIFGEERSDIVFETAGSRTAAAQALLLAGRGARIMVVGTIPEEVPVNFLKINREVRIETVFRYANRFPVVIDAIRSGKIKVKDMATHVYEYGETQRAFEQSLCKKAEIIKGLIKIE